MVRVLGLADGDPLDAPAQRGEVALARRSQARAAEATATRAAETAATTAFAATLEHVFGRPELLAEALTHSSVAGSRQRALESNERLEFLGDRVLGLLIAEWLAERFPLESEGDLGKRLAVLVSAESLTPVAEKIGLGAALRVPPGERRAGVGSRATVLADAMEALLGALYLDGGLPAARALVRREWAALLEASIRPPQSAKSRLQEWSLGRALGLPSYVVIETSGLDHTPTFTVRAAVGDRHAEGRGENKRAAEQLAAARLLEALEAT